MRIDANVTYDIQYDRIIRVNSKEVYQSGAFTNFDSWETTSISFSCNKPNAGWVTFTIKGRMTCSYADPIIGLKTGYTSNETKEVKINCN